MKAIEKICELRQWFEQFRVDDAVWYTLKEVYFELMDEQEEEVNG